MLPKVKEKEHYRKEAIKAKKDPEYVIQPYQVNIGGRPKKETLAKAKLPKGRPPKTSRIEEFKQRLLATNGQKVIDKVIQIALEDGHKDQVVCLKMCMDRVLPVSLFEKNSTTRPSITINIENSTVAKENDGTITTIDIEAVEQERESDDE